MKCPCCRTEMVKRSGKFGEFFYCASHGTLSVNSGKVVATKDISKKLAYKKIMSLSQVGNCVVDQKGLEFDMQKQMMNFGVQLNGLDKFIEGETLELMQMNACDDDDHWLNLRPY